VSSVIISLMLYQLVLQRPIRLPKLKDHLSVLHSYTDPLLRSNHSEKTTFLEVCGITQKNAARQLLEA